MLLIQWPGSGDYFHLLHHAHFDCNYGSPHVPLDWLFGTFAGSKAEVGESTWLHSTGK
jgi:sterol desaturase/sphingolipid hydroxylase (fatty acid hydroxylase superfamily)